MFTIIDAEGILFAVLAAGLVVALPGVALARAFSMPGATPIPAVVAALAVLPALASLTARLAGLDGALALDLALAIAGAICLARARDTRLRLSSGEMALLGLWLALILLEWVDLDIGGRLYQPSTIIDTVKHAATTQTIVDGGVPPRDAFFLRPERASYYYYFYTITALVERACLGVADAKAAVAGLVFWVGVGLFALVGLALDRAGIVLSARGTRRTLLTAAVLCAGGLDVVALIGYASHSGVVLIDPLWWNEQISIWSESLLWVPHHVTALIAATTGLIAICEASAAATLRGRLAGAGLAILAFAATLGLSVWVCLALVVTATVWTLVLLVERRWRMVAVLAAAGIGAIVLSVPTLLDLRAGRVGGEIPIAVSVRSFTLVDGVVPEGPWRVVARLLGLPFNYLLEFGVLAVGAWLYWAGPGRAAPRREFARVLAIMAASGLMLGAFLSSTLINNDLGWRVTLFPLLAGSVWTIAVLDRALAERPARASVWAVLPPRFTICLVLGWATSFVALATMRLYPWLPLQQPARFIAADPRTARELRVAYGWAGAHLPHDVLQHNPAPNRAFAFGLYGRNPTSLSDHFGTLYGAGDTSVSARLAALTPVYRRALPPAAVKRVARSGGIDALIVTASDPVWSAAGSFVWTTPPLYASDRVRIIPVDRLGG